MNIENFKIERIKRSDIKIADYNPRFIDEENKEKLKEGIKKFGLVEPLIWNKRTGTLVSGHQRLSIIDKLKKGDYELTVSVIDVDEKDEKILNVQLNNKSMQGEFDIESLGNLSLDYDINISDFGFSDLDIEMMYGANEKFAELLPDTAEVAQAKRDIEEVKKDRREMVEQYKNEQSADFYFIVVCKDQKEKDEILTKMNVPIYEQYVTVEMLRRLIKNG